MRRLLLALTLLPSLALADAEPVPSDPVAPAPAPVADPMPTTTFAPTPAPAQVAPEPVTPDRYAGVDQPPPGSWRLMLSDLTVFRLNPIGLETRGRFGMQRRLYASEKAITKTNFAFAGIYPKLNPAAAILAVGGELQPASIFNLRATAEIQQFFGTFGFLQSFTSANANYSDQTLKDLRDDATLKPQAARLLHAAIQPTLQVKVGPIAVRGMLQLDYWALAGVRDGETTAYEATFDTLLPDKGWTLSTDVDVLYTGKKGVAVGLRHSHVRPFYKRRHFADQADFAAYDGENAHSRLGLFGAYTFRDQGPSRFNKPTVILIVSFYHQHRYRLGEPDTLPAGGRADDYTSRAFPYLLAGFAFESDFWDVR